MHKNLAVAKIMEAMRTVCTQKAGLSLALHMRQTIMEGMQVL